MSTNVEILLVLRLLRMRLPTYCKPQKGWLRAPSFSGGCYLRSPQLAEQSADDCWLYARTLPSSFSPPPRAKGECWRAAKDGDFEGESAPRTSFGASASQQREPQKASPTQRRSIRGDLSSHSSSDVVAARAVHARANGRRRRPTAAAEEEGGAADEEGTQAERVAAAGAHNEGLDLFELMAVPDYCQVLT